MHAHLPESACNCACVQGRFRPSKLQIAPDEGATLEAEFSSLLSAALRAAAFNKVRTLAQTAAASDRRSTWKGIIT